MQLHLLKCVVEIEKVKLIIRFPGQLSFQFKNNHLYENIPKQFPLANGECHVGQSVSFETEAAYDANVQTYQKLLVDLIISINTASGKIVAGVITFNCIQNQVEILPFKRCSDKTAEATLNIGFAKIQKIKDIEQEISPLHLENHVSLKLKENQKKSSQQLRMPPFLVKDSSREKAERNSSNVSKEESKIKGLMQSKSKLHTGDSRYREMQETYEKKMKLVIKEKDQLQAQLERIREKWKMSERREKQSQITTKELKDIVEKRRIKILEFEIKQAQLEKNQIENERKIKSLQQDAKQAKEKIQDLEAKCNIAERKIETKETIVADREKRLTQKLQQIEKDHSKSVHQYNFLLEKMEAQEKASQILFKNREKTYLQDRAKWKEQLQRLEKQNTKLNEQNDQNSNKCVVYLANQKIKISKIHQLEAELENLKNSDESKRIIIERDTILKKQLEREIQSLKNVDLDKANLKKKHYESSQENLRLRQKLEKATFDCQELREQLKGIQINFEELKKEKKVLTLKYAQLQKINGSHERQIARLSSENNTLLSKQTYLNQRFNDLRTKHEQAISQHSQNESGFIAKINSLLQSKQYLESDIEDYKWNLEKEKEKTDSIERKTKQKGDEILSYQEEIMKIKKETELVKMKVDEKAAENAKLYDEILDYRKKEREQAQILKEKERKIYQITKKLSEFEQQSFLSDSKLNIQLQDYKDIVSSHEKKIEELNQELEITVATLKDLIKLNQQLEENQREAQRQIKILSINLDDSERTLKQQNDKNVEIKKELDKINKQLELSQNKLNQDEKFYIEEISTLRTRKQQLQKLTKSQQSDLEIYKKATQQLLMIISKQEETSKNDEIMALPDKNLAKNQLQALMNRNKYISNFKNTILELEVQINYLEKEIDSKTKSLNDKNQELQDIIKNNSAKQSQSEEGWRRQRQNLTDQLELSSQQKETLRGEKEKLQNKCKSLKESQIQQKLVLQETEGYLATSKEQIKHLNEKILELRTMQIKSKGDDEAIIHNFKLQLNSELDKQKQKNEQLLKQVESLQKTIAEKEKLNISLKVDLKDIEQSKLKEEEELKKLQKRYLKQTQEKSQLELSLSQAQNKYQNALHSLEKANIQTESERSLKKELEDKLKQSHEHASQLLIAKENLENKLNTITKTSSLSQEEQKTKIIQLEEALQNQIKKSAKLFENLTETNNKLEIQKFETKQIERRFQQSCASNNELRKELQEKRTQINRLNTSVEGLKIKLLETEKERAQHSQEKGSAYDQLSVKKSKIDQLLAKIETLNAKIESLTDLLQNKENNIKELNKEKQGLINNVTELKDNLAEAKKEVQRSNAKENQFRNKLAFVQDQLKEKEEFYQDYKNKNWEENQKEVNSLRDKAKRLQAIIDRLENEGRQEKEELKTQLQYFAQENHELEELIQEKEEFIEQQRIQNVQAQNRIISLNGQLRSCLEAWEKEKSATIPSRRQSQKIEESMNKFQIYASELERKSKEVFNSATFKMKDEFMTKTAQSLIELLSLIQQSRSRAVNRATDTEKVAVSQQYEAMQQKIEQVLRTQKNNQQK